MLTTKTGSLRKKLISFSDDVALLLRPVEMASLMRWTMASRVSSGKNWSFLTVMAASSAIRFFTAKENSIFLRW